jgi:hypothetical protein
MYNPIASKLKIRDTVQKIVNFLALEAGIMLKKRA